MRDASDLFGQITDGSRTQRIVVDVLYDDERIFQDLPVADWSLSWDLESELKSTGTLQAVYSSIAGESLSPAGFLDVLAPYGQQVNVLLEVAVGGFYETLQLGRFRINQTPNANDSYFTFLGQTLTAGSLVNFTVDDLLSGVKRHGFHWPEPPQLSDSTWNEIQRITDLPVNPSLTDTGTPPGLIYQNTDGGRLAAVQQLASALGGIAVTNSFGEVTAVPFDYGAPVATLSMGPEGKVLSSSRSIDSDGFYNVVVGDYQEKDGTPIFVDPARATGNLDPEGPFGEYTYYDKSDAVQTYAAAQQRVQSVLQRLIDSQSYRMTLSCIADYRLEYGDVVTFVSLTGSIVGRIISIKFTADGLMEVVLDVRP